MTSLLSPSASSGLSTDSSRVKVVIVGDAGVGKTALVQSVIDKPIKNPPWTIGCSVEIIVHSYRAGTPQETSHFVELWDIGGSRSHQNSRRVFYHPVHGLVLVHDLTNRKSQENLRLWMSEVFTRSDVRVSSPMVESPFSAGARLPTTVYDGEQYVGERDIPILVVGTKLDQLPANERSPPKGVSKVAADCGADEIVMDCRQAITPGSTNGLKVTKFFDRVIECQSKKGRMSAYQPGTVLHDRRRKVL